MRRLFMFANECEMTQAVTWPTSIRRLWRATGLPAAGAWISLRRNEANRENTRTGRRRPPRTIRRQLLVGVNLVMSILLTTAIALDYQRELTHRIAERRIALEEEAKTIAAALPGMSHHGPNAIQEFLNAVCGSLSESESPGHHLIVQWEGSVYQPTVHGRSTDDSYDAVRMAAESPDGRARLSQQELVAASRTLTGGIVYVSGYVTGIRQLILKENVRRFLGLLLAGIVAAGVVNVVLYRGLASPLERLVRIVEHIAQGQLGLQAGRFRTSELALLAAAINNMSQSLAANERDRTRQLQKARQLQEHLLQDWPAVRGMRIERRFRPATDVTGDYTDLAVATDGRVVLCLADVCGHGIPAAMGAAMLKTLFLEAVEGTSQPADVLHRLNARFGEVVLPGDFASMFVMSWDAQQRRLEYASAGHEPPWLCRSDGDCVPLAASGMLLGVCGDGLWPSTSVQIEDGDRLLLLTDGVIECLSPTGELFGRNRPASLLQEGFQSPIRETVVSLEQALERHRENSPLKDDVTIVLVEFNGAVR